MARLTMILLMTFILTGISKCQTEVVCKDIDRAKVVHLPFCDISFVLDRCRCRCFDINNFTTVKDNKCGNHFESGNFEVEHCEGIAGFRNEKWAIEVKPNINRLNNIKEDYCD